MLTARWRWKDSANIRLNETVTVKGATTCKKGKKTDNDYGDFWRVHDNRYDLSPLIDKYPGGSQWLEEFQCWQDFSQIFLQKDGHSAQFFLALWNLMDSTWPWNEEFTRKSSLCPRKWRMRTEKTSICCLWSSCSLPWCRPVTGLWALSCGWGSKLVFSSDSSVSWHHPDIYRAGDEFALGSDWVRVSWTPLAIVVMLMEICWPNWFRTAITSFIICSRRSTTACCPSCKPISWKRVANYLSKTLNSTSRVWLNGATTREWCLESSRPKRSTVIWQLFSSDDDSTSRCGMQFGHRRPFLFALPTPSYLLNFVPPSTPSFSFSIFGLCLLSVVHNSALSSCPLFASFNFLLSSIQRKFRLIRCVKSIKCPQSETSGGPVDSHRSQ